MKMIDVFNLMAEEKIEENTTLIVSNGFKEFEYKYRKVYRTFVDEDLCKFDGRFNIDKDFLDSEVRLEQPKPKKYLVKINIRGLIERFTYLNYSETSGRVNLHDKYRASSIQTHFTKDELQSIKSVKEFLEDIEGKYELIEVEDDEID